MKNYCLLALAISTALCAMEKEKEPKVHFGATPYLPEFQRPRTLYGRELARTREAEGHKTRRKGGPASKKKLKYTQTGIFSDLELEKYLASPSLQEREALQAQAVQKAEFMIQEAIVEEFREAIDAIDERLQEIVRQLPDLELYGDPQEYGAMSMRLAQVKKDLQAVDQKITEYTAVLQSKLAAADTAPAYKTFVLTQLAALHDVKKSIASMIEDIHSAENKIALQNPQKEKGDHTDAQ